MITSEESSPKQSEKTSLSLSKWELAIIILGSFSCMLNQNIISPLLPVMMNTFSIGAEAIQSLTTMYMLVSAIMIPTTAFLS